MRNFYKQKGSRNWWYRETINGKSHRFSTRTDDRDLAEEVAKRWRQKTRVLAARTRWDDSVDAMIEQKGSWIYACMASMRARTKRKGYKESPMNLAQLEILVRSCGGHCQVSGVELRVNERHPFQISIDRIDVNKGYCHDNCRIVALMVNVALGRWGETSMREMCMMYAAKCMSEINWHTEIDKK